MRKIIVSNYVSLDGFFAGPNEEIDWFVWDEEEEILDMKEQPGKDMVIYGSGSLVSTLAQSGLIDDYRIFVNPVVLGSGKHLFAGLKERLKLNLLSTKTFRCGVVLLHFGL